MLFMMWFFQLVLFIGLVCLISGRYFNALVKDKCFKKLYVCGDLRGRDVDVNDSYIADVNDFMEMCETNKQYIDCITDVKEKFYDKEVCTDFAKNALEHKMSMLRFCKLPEYQKDYFANVGCINIFKDLLRKVCVIELNSGDMEPLCRYAPDPCESQRYVWLCTFREMERYCGRKAAEVYERLFYLNLGTLDVLCELRIRNPPPFCNYELPDFSFYNKWTQQNITNKIGSLSEKQLTSHLEGMLSESLEDLVEQFQNSLKQHDSSNIQDDLYEELIELIEEYNFQYEQRLKDNIEQVIKVPRDQNPNLITKHESLLKFNSLKQEKARNKEIFHSTMAPECGKTMMSFTDELLSHKESRGIADYIDQVKDSVLILYKLLKKEDTEIIDVGDEHIELNWRNLNNLFIQQVFCSWTVDSSGRVFRCNIEMKSTRRKGDRYSEPDFNDPPTSAELENSGAIGHCFLISPSMHDNLKDTQDNEKIIGDKKKSDSGLNDETEEAEDERKSKSKSKFAVLISNDEQASYDFEIDYDITHETFAGFDILTEQSSTNEDGFPGLTTLAYHLGHTISSEHLSVDNNEHEKTEKFKLIDEGIRSIIVVSKSSMLECDKFAKLDNFLECLKSKSLVVNDITKDKCKLQINPDGTITGGGLNWIFGPPEEGNAYRVKITETKKTEL